MMMRVQDGGDVHPSSGNGGTKVDELETEHHNLKGGQRRLRCGQRVRGKTGSMVSCKPK